MACSGRPATVLTISLVYLLALFGSYCQMAPAVVGASRGWEVGNDRKYKLTTTLLFSEAAPTKSSGDVGFRLTGELDVTAVWQKPDDDESFLLKIQLLSPQLWIKSRRAPEPEGFVEHSSRIDKVTEKPVLIMWRNGDIQSVFMDPSESVSSSNLKRGLASLFQYETRATDGKERDASGLCHVKYDSVGPRTMHKRKMSCESSSLPARKRHPNPLFDARVKSTCDVVYELGNQLLPDTVHEKERHEMTLAARSEMGTIVTSTRTLELVSGATNTKTVQADTLKQAVAAVLPGAVQVNIELELEPLVCPDSGCPTIEGTIEEYRSALDASSLGTGKSASAFLKLVPLVKSAPAEELFKLLKSPRYRQLKPQLLDIFGSASSLPSHQAAMKILRQDETGDDTERYLWALSLSPIPNADVAKDILKRSEETIPNDKVSETIALTAAAMARHLKSSDAVEKARVSLELGLESCTGEDCQLKFLRALRNLRSEAAIPTLLRFALSNSKALSVAAWKALAALPKDSITEEVKAIAKRVFYQIGGPRRDSSARTLALDIILETKPSKEDVEHLVEYLTGSDPAYEIRKYLTQRMIQLSRKYPQLNTYLTEALKAAGKKVTNYNVFSQRGLSTAFTRNFLKSEDSSGYLETVQEINSGLLKRGVVDVVLEVGSREEALFSLGLFAGGLGSFVSSNSQEEDGQDDEPTTAGMEIDFLGVGIRPFVFFSGQGELMGHVWSGTASERTPAFQALAAVHSHREYIPLTSGMVAEVDVQGAVSFDLAGQIQLSLWSRNAQSLVDLKAGVAIQGGTKVRSNFVQSMAEFSMTMEPKLELATDVDFSGPVSLCMRLSQPVNTVRYQVYKVERVAGSRHKLRKTRRMRLHSAETLTCEYLCLQGTDLIRVSRFFKDSKEGKFVSYIHEDARTMYDVFRKGAKESNNGPCLGWRDAPTKPYQWIHYNETLLRAKNFGSGLVTLGLQPGSHTIVGLYSQNCPEWILTEQACYTYSLVVVPLYDTLGPDACAFIINQAEINLVVCENDKKCNLLLDKAPRCLRKLVVIKETRQTTSQRAKNRGVELLRFEDVERLGAQKNHQEMPPKVTDLCTICYTSGTTGNPKGVMLTHQNVVAAISAVLLQLGEHRPSYKDTMISFLPLAHMLERCCENGMYMVGGSVGFYSGDIKRLTEDMKALRPTVMPAVPRLLNRMYDKIQTELQSSCFKRLIFNMGMRAKETQLKKGIIRTNSVWDKLVFAKIKETTGGRLRLMMVGSAPLAGTVLTFARCALGCLIVEGYGQTECGAPITLTIQGDHVPEHVGPPVACCCIKLVDVPEMEYYVRKSQGEVCVKGTNVFVGYFKDPEKTAEAIDEFGWHHTGDIGMWLPNGTLKIIDRKKHTFKLSQGEYIVPEKIEAIYLRSQYVYQVFVHGESLKSCVVGIVIPDVDVVKCWAVENGIPGTLSVLCANPQVKQLILGDMLAWGKEAGLKSFEQVKDIYLHPDPFSVQNGLLTPTLKTRRPQLKEYFKPQIEDLYRHLD